LTFLNYSKRRIKSEAVHKKMKRKLLESVNRKLNFVQVMLPNQLILEMGKDLNLLEVIKAVYLQQKQMYDHNTNSCKDRIVSIYQPHVQPVLRAKQNARVEFGAKLGANLDNRFAYLNHLS
jgi:hypothetical protein